MSTNSSHDSTFDHPVRQPGPAVQGPVPFGRYGLYGAGGAALALAGTALLPSSAVIGASALLLSTATVAAVLIERREGAARALAQAQLADGLVSTGREITRAIGALGDAVARLESWSRTVAAGQSESISSGAAPNSMPTLAPAGLARRSTSLPTLPPTSPKARSASLPVLPPTASVRRSTSLPTLPPASPKARSASLPVLPPTASVRRSTSLPTLPPASPKARTTSLPVIAPAARPRRSASLPVLPPSATRQPWSSFSDAARIRALEEENRRLRTELEARSAPVAQSA